MHEAFSCEAVASLAFDPLGERIAFGNVLGQVTIWDLARQQELAILEHHDQRVACLDWTAGGLLSGSKDRRVALSDPRAPKAPVSVFRGHNQEVCGVKWSCDGGLFASGGNDNIALVWDPRGVAPFR